MYNNKPNYLFTLPVLNVGGSRDHHTGPLSVHESPRDHGVCTRHHQNRDAVHDHDNNSVIDVPPRHHWVAVIVVDARPMLGTPNLQREQLKTCIHADKATSRIYCGPKFANIFFLFFLLQFVY